MSKKEKIDLKTPDTFHSTSDKIFHWIERHAQVVGLAVGAAVILSLGWIGYGYLDQRREARAAEALFQPESSLRKVEARVREERDKASTGVAGFDKKKPQPAPKPVDFDVTFGADVARVEDAIRANASTRVALIAALNLSHLLVEEKQYDRALKALELATFRPRTSDLLNAFLQMHRGLALIETAKYADAGAAYRAVLEVKALDAFHPDALLKLGLTQELGGDLAAAQASYEKLGRDFPGTEASLAASQYLRLLTLKKKG